MYTEFEHYTMIITAAFSGGNKLTAMILVNHENIY